MVDFLVLDERTAGVQPIVRQYQGVITPAALSAVFGTALATTGQADNCIRNRVRAINATTLYAVVQDGLYKSTDSGATFTLDNAFTSPLSGDDDQRQFRSGIYFAYGNNTTYLCGAFHRSTGPLVGWRLDLGTDTYTETVGGPGLVDFTGSEILHNNILHIAQRADNWYTWDPITQTVSSYNMAGVVGTPTVCQDYAVASDGLLYVSYQTSAGQWRMGKFTGSWTDLGNIYATGPSVAACRPGLFSDGTDLFTIMLDSSGGTPGWKCRQISSPFTTPGGEITTTVFSGHPALLSTGDGGSASASTNKRCMVVQDTETTPGTVITYIAFADNSTATTAWSWYQWQGSGSAITFLGAGGVVGNGIPTVSSGGFSFYTVGQKDVRITNRAATTGGEQVTFIASGGGTGTVRFRWSTQEQPTTSLATLIGPVTGGGSLGTNEVTGVTADGVTVNTVVWSVSTDGLSSNDRAVLVPEIT